MKHFLTIEHSCRDELVSLIDAGARLKAIRRQNHEKPLAGQVWAMIFTKSSTRTRVSFEVGVRELGGDVMFLSKDDLQLGRGEPVKDTARVLGRMAHGAIIRTGPQTLVDEFAEYSNIPTINALTDEEHPCQILADLLTIREKLGGWAGKKVVFCGDGDCNMGRSWMWAAKHLGFELVIAAPTEFQPPAELVEAAGDGVTVEPDMMKAAEGAHVLYTDVWVSMGKEEEAAERLKILTPYQLNSKVLGAAHGSAIVLHCLPAYREKEITEDVLELHADTIFQQAENRLHAQKAVLAALVNDGIA
ncbi:MAG: ornithine carbamoyltransferase [Verrucomicrobiota bacterium]